MGVVNLKNYLNKMTRKITGVLLLIGVFFLVIMAVRYLGYKTKHAAIDVSLMEMDGLMARIQDYKNTFGHFPQDLIQLSSVDIFSLDTKEVYKYYKREGGAVADGAILMDPFPIGGQINIVFSEKASIRIKEENFSAFEKKIIAEGYR